MLQPQGHLTKRIEIDEQTGFIYIHGPIRMDLLMAVVKKVFKKKRLTHADYHLIPANQEPIDGLHTAMPYSEIDGHGSFVEERRQIGYKTPSSDE